MMSTYSIWSSNELSHILVDGEKVKGRELNILISRTENNIEEVKMRQDDWFRSVGKDALSKLLSVLIVIFIFVYHSKNSPN